jgi:hydroxymethylpyrimidine/phosphomethylpyrimidine kinase
MHPIALTIAGSDPSGGAGIQADLKTFHQFGVYGEAVITLVTVQNTLSLEHVECLPAVLVLHQIRAVLDDIPPLAGKTGALGNRQIVESVARAAEDFRFPLVVDPVMVSQHGRLLVSEDAREAIRNELAPRAFLLMPNLAEAAVLTGLEVRDVDGMHRAARALRDLGAKAVLVKGGHLEGDAVDVLHASGLRREFRAERIVTRHTHGTGCTYSAAVTAGLALGESLEDAIAHAKAFVTEALRSAPGLGRGSGPLNHHAVTQPKRRGAGA